MAGVRNAFDASGSCNDAGTENALRQLADSLLDFIREYVCPRFELEAMWIMKF